MSHWDLENPRGDSLKMEILQFLKLKNCEDDVSGIHDYRTFLKEHKRKGRPLPLLTKDVNGLNGHLPQILKNKKDPFSMLKSLQKAQLKWKAKVSLGIEEIKSKLLGSVMLKSQQDAIDVVRECRQEFRKRGVSLYDRAACESCSGKNILHVAVEKNKWTLAQHLVHDLDPDYQLLRSTFPYTHGGITSEKTCLFMLIEKHSHLKKPVLKRHILSFTAHCVLTLQNWAKTSKNNMALFHQFLEEPSVIDTTEHRATKIHPLHLACYLGNACMANLLLAHKADPDVVNIRGETALMWAMLSSDPHTLSLLLLEHGARAAVTALDGSTALHWAVLVNDVSLILSLLRAVKHVTEEVNREKREGFHTPLVQAAVCGYDAVTDCLLRLGADVTRGTCGGQTAIHYAAAAGYPSTIRVLLKHATRGPHVEDKLGNTPLMFAIKGGHLAAAQLLLSQGASVYQRNQLGETPWSAAMELPGNALLKELIAVHNQRPLPHTSSIVSPLQVAVLTGKLDKLKFLLRFVNREETDVQHENTFVHVAAANNVSDVLRDTLLPEDALIKAQNRNKDTPLHLATKAGYTECVEILLHYAKQSDILQMDKKVTFSSQIADPGPAARSIRRQSITQFYISAMGSSSKLQRRFSMASMVDEVDELDNTCLHLAVVQQGGSGLVEDLVRQSKKINAKNVEGNTALHMAALHGNEAAVRQLIAEKDINLGLRNNRGDNALQMVLLCNNNSSRIVRILVEAIQFQDPDVLTFKNKFGNTALHIACKMDKIEDVQTLIENGAPPITVNNDGNNPLHVARFQSAISLRRALELLRSVNLEQENYAGETVLEVCAKRGQQEYIAELVRAGADLAHVNRREETVLHIIVRQSQLEPASFPLHEGVYQAICDAAVTWWCLKHDAQLPLEEESLEKLRCYAVLRLTSEMRDAAGMSVIHLAVKIGARDMVALILNTPGVYCAQVVREGRKCLSYDISGISPAHRGTFTDIATTGGGGGSGSGGGEKPSKKPRSCIGILAKMAKKDIAVEILKISPITQVVDHYYGAFQWISLRLMILHVVYMATFSTLVIPTLRPDEEVDPASVLTEPLDARNTNMLTRNMSNQVDNNHSSKSNDLTFVAFLFWPFILMMTKLATETITFPSFVDFGEEKVDVISFLRLLIHWLYDSVPLFGSVIFPVLMCIWFLLHIFSFKEEIYVLLPAIMIGWFFTISLTVGIKGLHTFCEMFRYILVRDIARFMCLYAFVLSAHLFTLHSYFQVVPEMREQYPTVSDTLFILFNLMVGIGGLFEGSTKQYFTDAGYSAFYAQLIYVSYLVLSMIIMMNLLIAMVNDTYESVKSREGTAWRRSTVMFAVRIETSLHFLKRFFMHPLVNSLENYAVPEVTSLTLKTNHGHLQTVTWKRYKMVVVQDNGTPVPNQANNEDIGNNSHEIRSMQAAIENLEQKIGDMQTKMAEEMSAVPRMVEVINQMNIRLIVLGSREAASRTEELESITGEEDTLTD